MTLFLIDENLPAGVGTVFETLGFKAESVLDHPVLRGKPDGAVFQYAVTKRAVLVTRDLGFAKPGRFTLHELAGLIIIRFPNEISISVLITELRRLLQDVRLTEVSYLLVVEPGSVRRRSLSP
jgi:predicted nuclease of predicted toxin-antitoxin system